MANSAPLNDGPVGIGTANPNANGALLQIQLAAAGNLGISLGVGTDANPDLVPLTLYPRANAAGGFTWYLTRNQQDAQGLSIEADGTVKVGGALKIKTWEISVPDHVFCEGYPLPPLSAVAGHVRAHGHLPEVPSAAEIGAGGLDAGGMILILLKKIEELTLYLLAQEERLSLLENPARPATP